MTQDEKSPKDLFRDKLHRLRDESVEIAKSMGLGPEYGPYIVQLLTPTGVHEMVQVVRSGSDFKSEYFEAVWVQSAPATQNNGGDSHNEL